MRKIGYAIFAYKNSLNAFYNIKAVKNIIY